MTPLGVLSLLAMPKAGKFGDEADGVRSCERAGRVDETERGAVIVVEGAIEATDRRTGSAIAADLVEAMELTEALRERGMGREGSGAFGGPVDGLLGRGRVVVVVAMAAWSGRQYRGSVQRSSRTAAREAGRKFLVVGAAVRESVAALRFKRP